MAATAILDFRNFISCRGPEGRDVSPCQISSKSVNSLRSYRPSDFRLFKMAAVRHLGFVLGIFGPSPKSTWWSLSLCTIWLQSIQKFRKYESLNFSHVGLKTPIHAPKIGVLREM